MNGQFRCVVHAIVVLGLFFGLAIGTSSAQPAAAETQAEIAKLRAEIVKLRTELAAATREIKRLSDALPDGGLREATFRGKPARYWLDQVNDTDPAFREVAVRALGNLAAKDRRLVPLVIKPLVNALVEKEDLVAHEAGVSLGQKIGAEALPALIEILKDKKPTNDESRHRALQTIQMIGAKGKPAIPVLIQVAREQTNGRVSPEAIRTLGAIGPGAAEAVPFLVDSLEELLRQREKSGGPFPSGNITIALFRIEPMIAEFVPSPYGPGLRTSGINKTESDETEKEWRQAIGMLKKKYPAAK